MSWLIDTNVLSELRKGEADAATCSARACARKNPFAGP